MTDQATRDEVDALAVALVSAQAEMRPATFNRVNPHFKSRYADLSAVRDATLPALNKNGLALIQTTEATADGLFLVTRLIHKSGQQITSTYPLPTNGTSQQIGSALTYARRYAWSSICGITADDDDDGEAAAKTNGSVRPASTTISEEQVLSLQAAIVEADADLPKFLKYLKVERLSDLSATKYADAMDALEAKRGKS